MYDDRLISAHALPSEKQPDRALRPTSLQSYIGQKNITELLGISITAAKYRGSPLDHTLIFGPPGLGKTTLANIIAYEMGVNIVTTTGPVLEKAVDLAAILNGLQANDILFIDEIHRLPPKVEEVLYSAMEDYEIDILIGEGAGANTMRLPLSPFTLVGATTRAGSLTAPLYARFGNHYNLQFYTHEELGQIIINSGLKMGMQIDIISAGEIARRSRGTPRVANRLLRRVRDFADVLNSGVVTPEITCLTLDKLDIDPYGLDQLDYRLLDVLINRFKGTAGIDALASSIGEDKVTLEDVVEPYLIQQGFIIRTPRGRAATDKARAYLAQYLREEEDA